MALPDKAAWVAIPVCLAIAAWLAIRTRQESVDLASGGPVAARDRGESTTSTAAQVGPESSSLVAREAIPLPATRIRVVDEVGAAVAGAEVWKHGAGGPAHSLGVSRADGALTVRVEREQTPLQIVATGFVEQSLTVDPGEEIRVALARAYDLEFVCVDARDRPMGGVLIAMGDSPLPDDWLKSAAGASDSNPLREGGRYAVRSNGLGVARFRGMSRFQVHWRVQAPNHALVGGPGITDDRTVELPGSYRLQFAPLVAAGFAVEGDRVAGVHGLKLRGDNLFPRDRSGATQEARAAIQAAHPGGAFLEVMGARDPGVLARFQVDVTLVETGTRTVQLEWRPVEDYLRDGPMIVRVNPGSGPKTTAHAGKVLIRICNPDGYEHVGRDLVLSGDRGIYFVVTGEAKEIPVGEYRVQAREATVNAYLSQRRPSITLGSNGLEEVLTLSKSLWPVVFRRPRGTPGTPSVFVRNEEGRSVGGLMRTNSDALVLLLPEKPLRACLQTLAGDGPEVPFQPQDPRGSGQVEVKLEAK